MAIDVVGVIVVVDAVEYYTHASNLLNAPGRQIRIARMKAGNNPDLIFSIKPVHT